MEHAIEKLIELEEDAQSIYAASQEHLKAAPETIRQEADILKKALSEETAQKCRAIEEAEKAATDKKLSLLESKKNAQIQRIRSIYNEQKDTWVTSLFDAITQ